MSANVTARANEAIAKTQHLPTNPLTIDKTFEELKFDSLDGINIVFAIETEFGIAIPDERVPQIKSVREMVDGIEELLAAKHAAGQAPQP